MCAQHKHLVYRWDSNSNYLSKSMLAKLPNSGGNLFPKEMGFGLFDPWKLRPVYRRKKTLALNSSIYLPIYSSIPSIPSHPIHPSTETYPLFFPYLAISLQPERLQPHAASPVPWLCTTSQNCDRAGGIRKTRSPKHEYQYVLYLLCHYVILYLLFINIIIYMCTYIYI